MSARTPWFASYSPLPGTSSSGLGLASIEAWPAAGGGLLIGMAEPAFAGAAPLRAPVKTVFLRVGSQGGIQLILPYVAIEAETRGCIRALVADELCSPEDSISISDSRNEGDSPVIDLHPAAERSVQVCGAVARSLLIAATAAAPRRTRGRRAAAGTRAASAGRTVAYHDLAADAALCSIPDRIRLQCGTWVDLAS